MPKKLLDKTKEALAALLPITIIVLILNFTITPMPFEVRGMFIIGAVLLVIGMGFFTLGADLALLPMGEHLGQYLSKSKNLVLMILAALVMGTMITIAEPDLQVLASQVPGIPNQTLVVTVAVGVGICLVVAILRILFQWQLRYILFALYLTVFILGTFIPQEYVPTAFDSSGVTTGPMTVPFILSFGVGIAAVRGGKSSQEDSFGLVALCSVGPIIAVMILTMFYDVGTSEATVENIARSQTIPNLIAQFVYEVPKYGREMAIALTPIVIFFLIFQISAIKLPASQLIKMGVGVVYTYIGLVLFLTGVSVGFLPAGTYIGQYVGALSFSWVLIPLGMIIGFFIVIAEPAVHVLVNQIEDLTGGAISKNTMLNTLSISTAISVGLAMIRVYTGISIWWMLVPGFSIALGLTFIVPKMFTAIAFDSGGAASGPMATTFLLPFSMGASVAMGGNMLMDAFGTVAMVAMTPLITIQIVGFIYKIKVADTTDEELETIEDIADEIEESDFVDWGESTPLSEVYDSYSDVDIENMEFVASPEWAEVLHDENVWNEITSDNSYIDFDEMEMRHYQTMVKPEDFDMPKRNGIGNSGNGIKNKNKNESESESEEGKS